MKMKKEMLEILDDYWTEKNTTKTTIDKILSLFAGFLDGEAPEICRTIQANWGNNSDYMCGEIIRNIKNNLKANNVQQ